jgi:inosine-uridine nucleoside N-ribohydrolase
MLLDDFASSDLCGLAHAEGHGTAAYGGSMGAGNVTAAAELNIYCDLEAAWAVFNYGVPIRMVGLNVTRRSGFNQTDIDTMKECRRMASTWRPCMRYARLYPPADTALPPAELSAALQDATAAAEKQAARKH